jgi:hypothetical protein
MDQETKETGDKGDWKRETKETGGMEEWSKKILPNNLRF